MRVPRAMRMGKTEVGSGVNQRVSHVVRAVVDVSLRGVVSWPSGVRRLPSLEEFDQRRN